MTVTFCDIKTGPRQQQRQQQVTGSPVSLKAKINFEEKNDELLRLVFLPRFESNKFWNSLSRKKESLSDPFCGQQSRGSG